MSEIRMATADDDIDVVMMVKQFVRESGQDLPFSKDQVLANFYAMVDHPDFAVFTSWKGGDLIGLLVATKTQTLFSTAPIAVELAWFVSPDHRDGSNGSIHSTCYRWRCYLCDRYVRVL
jgi:hypothetical protein